jgi:hypothetical protein
MKGISKLAAAIRLFPLVALVAATAQPAIARGFCNIDGLGSKDLQQQVGSAAAAFFEGGSFLMTMLSAFERGENSKGKESGSQSGKAFNAARELYQSVKMTEDVDKRLAAVNVEMAASIAQASPSDPVFTDIAKRTQGQNPSGTLMSICSSASERMRGAAAEFLEFKQNQEKSTAVLLDTWTRVLFTGRAVSGIFAAAGGTR